MDYYFLAHTQIDRMLQLLQGDGYQCIAPRYIEDSINYATITQSSELPWGLQDEQSPGHYQIMKGDMNRAFGFTVPVQSVKPLLFKAKEYLWKVKRDKDNKLCFEPQIKYSKIAVFGIRPCDLRAIHIQDKVFIDNAYVDTRYAKRREKLFMIAMNCTHSHANCFCVSLGDKPEADQGFDVAMTEINNGFVAYSGTDKGSAMLKQLGLPFASTRQIKDAVDGINVAATQQKKSIPPLHQVETKLMTNLEHKQLDDIAKRCLSCGNCTNACPTCFCHTEHEEPAISGELSYHTREWDSCFTLEHSYTHGETYHANPKHRYRQWLTHKFSTWRDQFNTKGCVGCGRCITWCPVKIDVTDEINIICK